MRFARIAHATLGLFTVGSLAWGCSNKSDDCTANKSCSPYNGPPGSSGQNGTDAAGEGGGGTEGGGKGGNSGTNGGAAGDESAGAAAAGAPCEGSASPDSAECVIGDAYGLFVSLSGDDAAGDGSEAHPLATVTKALSLTGPNKLNRIYVCATPTDQASAYAEPDTLVIPDRVSVFGGFSCDAGVWAYDTTVKAHLKPASPIGATITNAQNGVVLEDLRIDAAAAAEDGTGASSFGMIVDASQGVVLTRVEIHAGKGGGGAAGADGSPALDGDPPGLAQNGQTAQCGAVAPASQDGGKALVKKCDSQGGNGGTGFVATSYSPLQDGAGGLLVQPSNGGKGSDTGGQAGRNGDSGLNGLPGAVGAVAASVGVFSATGYLTASGGDGLAGMPGFGGGGGGSSLGTATCVGASGGAGGMGGCGGQPGIGGKGGGASVALLSWTSGLNIDACLLVASTGGAGGNGGAGHGGGVGAPGGVGGAADVPNSIGKGGAGGEGGNGGNGGSGAGGTGGPSIALVYGGAEPKVSNSTTLTSGAAGPRGSGGQLGLNSANWGPDGSVGFALLEYEQK